MTRSSAFDARLPEFESLVLKQFGNQFGKRAEMAVRRLMGDGVGFSQAMGIHCLGQGLHISRTQEVLLVGKAVAKSWQVAAAEAVGVKCNPGDSAQLHAARVLLAAWLQGKIEPPQRALPSNTTTTPEFAD